MIIYEVNLVVDKEIYTEFATWLTKHVQEMLQFPGFLHALILKQELESGESQEKVTVQYQLESRQALTTYFTEYAATMREQGINLFKDKFSAERRIFAVQESFKYTQAKIN